MKKYLNNNYNLNQQYPYIFTNFPTLSPIRTKYIPDGSEETSTRKGNS